MDMAPRREAAAGDDPEVLHCLNGRTRQNLGHTKRMRLWSPFVFLSKVPSQVPQFMVTGYLIVLHLFHCLVNIY